MGVNQIGYTKLIDIKFPGVSETAKKVCVDASMRANSYDKSEIKAHAPVL
jgi:hypothetical protein